MLLTLNQIENELKCASGTARVYIDRFALPHYKIGRKVYWEVDCDKLESMKAFYNSLKANNGRRCKK